MSWTNKLSRTSKIVYGLIIGASSVGGITWLVSDNREHYSGVARPNLEKPSIHLPLNKVLASWTTNFTPAARWDDDWDRYHRTYYLHNLNTHRQTNLGIAIAIGID